jgi:hypothetical protein
VSNLKIHFSEFFGVSESLLDSYNAFNISLINDFPLFVDPFLLFESKKEEYVALHKEILRYVAYLRDAVIEGDLDEGTVKHLFYFPEIKQNWLGYSMLGNNGSGLGKEFADALIKNITKAFTQSNEKITEDLHIEKLCIIKGGVGKDNISDFTVNIIKRFLLKYTQKFALSHLQEDKRRIFSVEKAYFNYDLNRWMPESFILPSISSDYVILTPKDMLTKEDNWINSKDLITQFNDVASSIPNQQLRDLINRYFRQNLPPPQRKKRGGFKMPSQEEVSKAVHRVIENFPEYLDYYIRFKENNRDLARSESDGKVVFSESIFVQNTRSFVDILTKTTEFYKESEDSYEESMRRVMFLKQVIENNNGYRLFYVNSKPIKREKDVQVIFRLTWYASSYDVNSEVDNGRGPVDYKISFGNSNSTLVEFKLASNSKLSQNMKHQVKVYENSNQTKKSIKVILYFSEEEELKVKNLLKDLKLEEDTSIILIDARNDNKESASRKRDTENS